MTAIFHYRSQQKLNYILNKYSLRLIFFLRQLKTKAFHFKIIDNKLNVVLANHVNNLLTKISRFKVFNKTKNNFC